QWLQQIWGWFGEGVSGREIRRRLIDGGAPERLGGKHVWAIAKIYQFLKNDYYYTGHLRQRWNGEEYELPIPPLVDPETARFVNERFARWKKYPVGNLRAESLAAGRVFCKACQVQMRVIAHLSKGRRYSYYKCLNHTSVGVNPPECAKSVRLPRLDAEIWRKVYEVLTQPGKFERLLEERIKAIQAEAQDAEVECEKLQGRLGELAIEEQWIITQARKKRISEAQMEMQLRALALERAEAEKDLREKSLLRGDRAGRLLEAIQLYRQQAAGGLQGLNDVPINEEHAARQLAERRRWVDAIVARVEVDENKQPTVYADFGRLPISEESAGRR
ncbi:MAG: hypothetical protein JNK29_10135, partial [Anaerolineales bacterium]|nr:hypothetical protein [Anaerolineales bacterium]